MEENPFYTYQTFQDKLGAIEFSDFLDKNEIEFIIAESSSNSELTFNDINKEYLINIKQENFEKADKIQLEIIANSLDTISEDYYLFEFSDEELAEVITKNEEWSKLDYFLAQKILAARGKEIDQELLEKLNNQKSKENILNRDAQIVESKRNASKDIVYGALWLAAGIIATIATDVQYFFLRCSSIWCHPIFQRGREPRSI